MGRVVALVKVDIRARLTMQQIIQKRARGPLIMQTVRDLAGEGDNAVCPSESPIAGLRR
jgi:hypothetical protein